MERGVKGVPVRRCHSTACASHRCLTKVFCEGAVAGSYLFLVIVQILQKERRHFIVSGTHTLPLLAVMVKQYWHRCEACFSQALTLWENQRENTMIYPSMGFSFGHI